jgi:dUTP pyrophosphatase
MTKIQVLKNETYSSVEKLPKQATQRSTGRDIIATSDPEIVGIKHNKDGSGVYYRSIDYIQYRTNLFTSVQMNNISDYDILGFPRSSISKYNLMLANSICLIDADYRGEILLRFKYIWQPEDFIYVPTTEPNTTSALIVGQPNVNKIYKKGDTICQLKVTQVEDVIFELVDVLDNTQRGTGGFGSTTENKKSITLPDHLEKMYEKNSVPTPIKKYSDLIKEREN